MKYILTLACTVLAVCRQSISTNLADFSGTNQAGIVAHVDYKNPKDLFITDPTCITNVCWYTELDNPTNAVTLQLVTNVVTQWLPIEREEGQCGARVKQIGILVTNQVLTVIAYDKTNEMILKMLGREEWPSQKRVVVVPKTTGGPVYAK